MTCNAVDYDCIGFEGRPHQPGPECPIRPQEARSAPQALPDVESHVEMVLRAYGPLTQAQIATRVYGVSVHPLGDAAEDRKRRSAIRQVQHAIERLRRRDVPVVDSPDGMRIAATAEECEEEFRRLRSRIRSQSVTAWGLRRAGRVLRAIEEGRIAEPEPEQRQLWEAA